MSPLENAGVLIRANDGFVLGSCFLFRSVRTILTAGHCVDDYDVQDLKVMFPNSRSNGHFNVTNKACHTSADVAVLTIDGLAEEDVTWPVYLLFDERKPGVEFATIGYPQLVFEKSHDPPRYFKGYVQRIFLHESRVTKYRYMAAELSIACPAGLSGASLQHPELYGRLYGLVAENIEIATEKSAVEEVQEDGSLYRESYHSIINYGVAVWLPAIEDWLDATVPKPSDLELLRWSVNQRAWK